MTLLIVSSQNVGNRNVPSEVTGKLFLPNTMKNKTSESVLGSLYELNALDIKECEDSVPALMNPGTLQVYDFRRSFDDGRMRLERVAYKLTNGDTFDSITPSKLDSMLLKQKVFATPKYVQKTLVLPAIVRWLFVAMVAIFSIVMLRVGIKNYNKQGKI